MKVTRNLRERELARHGLTLLDLITYLAEPEKLGMSGRDADILIYYFGIGKSPRPISKIKDIYKLSFSAIQKIKDKGLRTLVEHQKKGSG